MTPEEIGAASPKKVWWTCEKGHHWKTAIAKRIRKQSGCPYYSGRVAIAGENDLLTLRPDIAAEWPPAKNGTLTPVQVETGSKQKVWWIYPKGHEYQAKIVYRCFKDSGCPYCAGRVVLSGYNELQTIFPEMHKNGILIIHYFQFTNCFAN